MSRRLDRSRPMWELTVVEGLSHGRVALVPKMHHALVDGMAAIDIGIVLLDPTPDPIELPAPESPWEPQRYDRARHLTQLSITRAFSTGRRMLESGRRALSPDLAMRALPEVVRATEVLAELARQRPQAPMTPLNRGIGPNRRYSLSQARLADLKRVAKAAGGTVNDAILAAVAGMLDRYFDATEFFPSARPVALVPVNVRKP